jgi:antigen flippase
VTTIAERPRPRLLVSATLALWAAQIVGLVGAIVRGKVNAVSLGPTGVGLVSQLNYLSTLVATVAAFGMWNGCIKLLAEARAAGDTKQEARLRSITLFYPFAAGLLIAAGISLAAGPVGHALLGVDAHPGAIVMAAFSVPAGLLATALSTGLQGRGEMRRLAVANTLIALGNTALVVLLVVAFGLQGAMAGVLLTSLVATLVLSIREPGLLAGVSFRPSVVFDRTVLRTILTFGAAAIVLSFASSGTDLGVRTLIVHRLGIASNGIYQPVTMLSTQLFLALVSALGIYLFPRLTALYSTGEREQANVEVNSGVRLMLAAAVPAVILTITLAPLLLRLVFSGQFVPARSALTWQMAGEVLRALGWTIGAVLLPLGLVRAWLGVGLLTLIVQAALVAALIGPLGLTGVSVAYSMSWLVNAAAAVAIARRRAGLRLEPKTVRAIGSALAFTAVSMAATRSPERAMPLVGVGLLSVWLAVTVRRGALREALAAVRGLRA